MTVEPPWGASWLWGAPLIVITVVIHVGCLALFTLWLERVLAARRGATGRRFLSTFVVAVGLAVAVITVLHALEAALWATAYRLTGALPDVKDAMLYSIGALTTFGHAPLYLDKRWALLGALEALNGVILFGLTTAFLFAIIQRVWPAVAPAPPVR